MYQRTSTIRQRGQNHIKKHCVPMASSTRAVSRCIVSSFLAISSEISTPSKMSFPSSSFGDPRPRFVPCAICTENEERSVSSSTGFKSVENKFCVVYTRDHIQQWPSHPVRALSQVNTSPQNKSLYTIDKLHFLSHFPAQPPQFLSRTTAPDPLSMMC